MSPLSRVAHFSNVSFESPSTSRDMQTSSSTIQQKDFTSAFANLESNFGLTPGGAPIVSAPKVEKKPTQSREPSRERGRSLVRELKDRAFSKSRSQTRSPRESVSRSASRRPPMGSLATLEENYGFNGSPVLPFHESLINHA